MGLAEGSMLYTAYAAARTPHADAFDEVALDPATLRPHWADFLSAIDRFGVEELARREGYARRLVQENGITYNVYGDPMGMDRPWALDLIPFMIPAADWAGIEAGLSQRAHLLNLVAADLFGEQRLLREAVIPAEFLFANPKFHRACHRLPPPAGGHVTLYGADLFRTPDGRWQVLSDRTQTPSGMGYSLENRIIMSRVYPNLIRECQVRRLASFFETLRGLLRGLAPRAREAANVVLLTPGPYNETYFEHAYLARYLGFTLAEGDDLTVRGNEVYLKTLEGLRRVDVLFRRLDDDFCDPLELRNDSTLGVAGLLQAIHHGNVAVSNMLGSALLEVRALGACLPRLCRHYFGSDLRLNPAPVWWCAIPEQRAYVEEHFDELYVGSAWSENPRTLVYVPDLSREERACLRDKVRAAPHDFVAQTPVTLSTAPTWDGHTLSARHVLLRAYTASGPDGPHVMPGGLTRFSETNDLRQLSMQQGSGSKDTWVRSDTPVSAYSLLPPPGQPIVLRRSPHDLPSRVADNLFWLGRYCERTEGVVRMLRHLVTRFTDEAGIASMPELMSLMRALKHLWPEQPALQGQAVPQAQRQQQPLERSAPVGIGGAAVSIQEAGEIERSLLAAIFDGALPSSVLSNLRALQRTAWVVRDRFSPDDWRIISGLGHDLLHDAGESEARGISEALVVLNALVTGLAAFSGLTMENMTRERGWLFLDMGRRVERALHTVRLIDSTCAEPILPEESTLQAVLIISDSPMTYRARYGANFRMSALFDTLLSDESNPRSVAFQVRALSDSLGHLPHAHPDGLLAEEERSAVRMLSELRLADAHVLGRLEEHGVRPALRNFLKLLLQELPRFSDLLAQRYFSHTGPARRFSARQSEPQP